MSIKESQLPLSIDFLVSPFTQRAFTLVSSLPFNIAPPLIAARLQQLLPLIHSGKRVLALQALAMSATTLYAVEQASQ
jgi:16S rRNA A1518/A1519 N6-dimethyltransferase RsmA/KsgA/DIM1 with predicted DNA glycosylase/AP lyase activity